jgi:hypothetical protein
MGRYALHATEDADVISLGRESKETQLHRRLHHGLPTAFSMSRYLCETVWELKHKKEGDHLWAEARDPHSLPPNSAGDRA